MGDGCIYGRGCVRRGGGVYVWGTAEYMGEDVCAQGKGGVASSPTLELVAWKACRAGLGPAEEQREHHR